MKNNPCRCNNLSVVVRRFTRDGVDWEVRYCATHDYFWEEPA